MLPKNEIRSINGIIMKKLFTGKFRMTNIYSISGVRGRGDGVKGGGQRGEKKDKDKRGGRGGGEPQRGGGRKGEGHPKKGEE